LARGRFQEGRNGLTDEYEYDYDYEYEIGMVLSEGLDSASAIFISYS
jgi:hypothetical protein